MTLGETLNRHLKAEKRGQLVIKFRGQEHLCKIAIEDGHAVYLSLGKKGPEETLEAIAGKQVEWVNFIDGMPARKRLPESLNKRLMEVALASAPVASRQVSRKPAPAAGFDLSAGAPPETVDAIIEDFVELIGPLGTVLADRVALDLGYREGALMEPDVLNNFVAALAGEIPDAQRQAFIDKYRA